MLLSLVNGAIRRTVNIGLSVQDAAEHVLRQLELQGPLAFDMRRAEDRHDAVRTTMEASLNLLEPNDLERYLDLAVFPEDVDIPVGVLYKWWTSVHGIGSDASEYLVEDFQRLSLLAMLRRANGATALRLHDVIRDYIRRRCGEAELKKRNQLLLDSAKLLPHGGGAAQLSDWWHLPREQEYLWRHLSFHLIEAGRVRELRTLVCDLRWIVAKIDVTGGTTEVEWDLILADSPESGRLARALARCSHVLSPVTPATVDTLLAYLAADPAPWVRASAQSFLATYSAPLLTPVWPLPDTSSPGVRRVIDDHRTWLRSCAAAPDGRWIATAGDDHMVRLFALDTGEAGPVLSGHLAPVRGCVFFPGGRRMASASDGATAGS